MEKALYSIFSHLKFSGIYNLGESCEEEGDHVIGQ